MKCRYCDANITFVPHPPQHEEVVNHLPYYGYWRDDSDDPGDGWGGDASCPARPRVDGRAQTHEPVTL